MKVAILCGGLATRLKEQNITTIKSLIHFNNSPFIYHQLALLQKNGLTDVVLCTGNGIKELSKAINLIDSFLKHYMLMNVVISDDGEEPLGTGGAIKKALPLLGDKFLVLYGDSYLDFDYRASVEKFELSDKQALMTIYHNKNNFDKSNVDFDGRRIVSYDKDNPVGEHIDYGANFFSKNIFYDFHGNFDLALVLKRLVEINQLDYDLISGRFYEIGSVQGIKDFENKIRRDNDFFRNVFK